VSDSEPVLIKKVRPELQAKLNLYRAEGFRALDAQIEKIMDVIMPLV